MKLNIQELLDFFDDRKNSEKGDANAIISILGEDLNVAAYKHFRNNKVEIPDESVLCGSKKGNRLDRWILDNENKRLFQCEIKNWAATAIGGKRLRSDADISSTNKVVEYHKNHELPRNFSKTSIHPNGVTKVLVKMWPPARIDNTLTIEPILIYWMPISFGKDPLWPLSDISVKSLDLPVKTEFTKLHIFSVSLYLRHLYRNGEKHINLDMPHFEHRMKLLDSFKG